MGTLKCLHQNWNTQHLLGNLKGVFLKLTQQIFCNRVTYSSVWVLYSCCGPIAKFSTWVILSRWHRGNAHPRFSSGLRSPTGSELAVRQGGPNSHLCCAIGSHLPSNKVLSKLECVLVLMLWVLLGNFITWVWSEFKSHVTVSSPKSRRYC